MKKRTSAILGLCGVVVMALVAWDSLGMIVWDGEFALAIRVVDRGRPVDRTRVLTVAYGCAVLPRMADTTMIAELSHCLQEAKFNGQDYIAYVPCGGTESGLRIRKTYHQVRDIFIKVELRDGKTTCLTCPVSDREHKPRIILDIGALMTQPTTERAK